MIQIRRVNAVVLWFSYHDYHAWIQEISSGGSRSVWQKKLWQRFFLVLSLFLRKSNGQFQRNLSFFKVSEGVQHFPGGGGGVQHFPGGSNLFQLLIPYRNPYNLITCDFPGGFRTPWPPPPLWIRTWLSWSTWISRSLFPWLSSIVLTINIRQHVLFFQNRFVF